jgi:hypothetical protein
MTTNTVSDDSFAPDTGFLEAERLFQVCEPDAFSLENRVV